MESKATAKHCRTKKRRTDVEKLCEAISQHPLQQAGLVALRTELEWPPEKLTRVIAKGLADPSCQLFMVRGGRSIRFRGSEARGGINGVGIYYDVSRIIEQRWAPKRHCREIVMHSTERARQRSGHRWSCPDLVMECHPGRKSSPDASKLIHAFEIESAGGFGIQSVYQAHAHGRGADFSWVVFQRGQDRENRDHPDWDRIVWAAMELGVGLIGFSNSNSLATWHVNREAKRRASTRVERQAFRESVLGRTFG